MGERPLPDEVARAARAYLAALVSPSARADAWHDLLAEVRYWQDDQLVPVLRLAHQVVGQHERVTDEAAAHALVDVGLAEVDDLARVLGASLDTARDLRERVERAQESVERPTGALVNGRASGDRAQASANRTMQPATEDAKVVTAEPQDMADATPVTAPASPSSTEATQALARPGPALRIGFDDLDAVATDTSDDDADTSDDDSDDWDDGDDGPSGGLLSYRRLIAIAVVVWVLVVVAWLLGGS